MSWSKNWTGGWFLAIFFPAKIKWKRICIFFPEYFLSQDKMMLALPWCILPLLIGIPCVTLDEPYDELNFVREEIRSSKEPRTTRWTRGERQSDFSPGWTRWSNEENKGAYTYMYTHVYVYNRTTSDGWLATNESPPNPPTLLTFIPVHIHCWRKMCVSGVLKSKWISSLLNIQSILLVNPIDF